MNSDKTTLFSDSREDMDSARLAGLLAELDRHARTPCGECGSLPCGHEVLFSVALGFKDAPRCAVCLARAMDRPLAELRDQLGSHMQHRDCFRQAWDVACDKEGLPPTPRPECLWPREVSSGPVQSEPVADVAGAEMPPASVWDAGFMSCGDLVLALRIRLQSMAGGTILHVTARDPAAPEDLPAWCRLTGHRLVRGEHPDYFIRRKES